MSPKTLQFKLKLVYKEISQWTHWPQSAFQSILINYLTHASYRIVPIGQVGDVILSLLDYNVFLKFFFQLVTI